MKLNSGEGEKLLQTNTISLLVISSFNLIKKNLPYSFPYLSCYFEIQVLGKL